MTVEQKKDFIAALRHFTLTRGTQTSDGYGRVGYRPTRGELLLTDALADYLADPHVPNEVMGINWFNDLGYYLVEAFSAFRTEPCWVTLRAAYQAETGYEIPDLINLHEGGLHRWLVVHELVRLMPILSMQGEWLGTRLECLFGAQMQVIDHAWQRFVRVAYRKLIPRIKMEQHRGNKGEFGTTPTTLMTYAVAGRVMFTFMRNNNAASITYVADDSDMYGFRAGPNVPNTPYAECVAMIDDVVDYWDVDKLVKSDTVGIGLRSNE